MPAATVYEARLLSPLRGSLSANQVTPLGKGPLQPLHGSVSNRVVSWPLGFQLETLQLLLSVCCPSGSGAMGRAGNLHLAHMDRDGPDSEACRALARIYEVALDAIKTGQEVRETRLRQAAVNMSVLQRLLVLAFCT